MEPVRIQRSSRRARVIRVFFVLVVLAQAALIVRSYADPHNFFGYQPFNESSTWEADIVRVTAHGERIPIDEPWPGGYEWNELVDWGVLEDPGRRTHAYSGLDVAVDFLGEALDWVADHTPRDGETLYLEADVTGFRNTRGPEEHTLRSEEREEAR